ncbi:MAG: bifunctional glutamate N-acetyltransferase/amino-acid acetyltransferase ArgJ [Thermoplasmatota archaeon]
MQLIQHPGLRAVAGFRAAGVHCGLKKDRPDLALIVSDRPAVGAVVTTQNAYAAAPVHVSRQHAADGDVRAIVVNAGIANACTGRQGLRDALEMARRTAGELGAEPEQVLVASTGIIGEPLPMEPIRDGIRSAAATLDEAAGDEAALAILTTDSGPKSTFATFEHDGRTYRLAGIAKGAGMVHPNLATMLSFLVTDAPVGPDDLRGCLRAATDRTFNQISIDGDESTNDMVAVLANGNGPRLSGEGLAAFQEALEQACRELAQQIAADGEGASRLLEVSVRGAKDDEAARRIARAVAGSNLVKAAIHGADANWGRILAAAGAADRDLGDDVTLVVGGRHQSVPVLVNGEAQDNRRTAAAALSSSVARIDLDVGDGDGQGEAWGCDLSPDYVRFNAEKTT